MSIRTLLLPALAAAACLHTPAAAAQGERFEGEGLTIVGVTSEGQGKTEPWIAKHEAKYPCAYDRGRELMRFFGVSGIQRPALRAAPTPR